MPIELISAEDKEAIIEQDIEYFEELFSRPPSANDKEFKSELLTYSLVKAKVKVMKFLMDNGTPMKKHDIELRNIVEKKKDVKILEYLESKNVDLSGNVLLWASCIKNNEPYTKFFADKIKELDNENVHIAVCQVFHRYKNNLPAAKGVLSILFAKITPTGFNRFLNGNFFGKEKIQENNAYIQKLYLETTLSHSQPSPPSPGPLKI